MRCPDCNTKLINIWLERKREIAVCPECKAEKVFQCQAQLGLYAERYRLRCRNAHHNPDGLCGHHEGQTAHDWEICPDCGEYKVLNEKCYSCFLNR